nr:uncharacterized protein LOC124806523 [Hydra vulgaris]
MASMSVTVSLQNCMELIISAKKNKANVNKYMFILKQVMKALNGLDYSFIRHGEFYHDLKETINKIRCQINILINRTKLSQIVMAKKDGMTYDQIQQQIDDICGRIVLASAQRQLARRKNSVN